MGSESFDVVRFDLGPLLQGQTRIVKVKSAYNSLIIGHRGFEMANHPIGNNGLDIFWCVVRFDLGPLQCQTRIAKLKSAYDSLIIGHTGLEW